MNILIDIGHPAHVHYYRNMANELTINGHKVLWSIKDVIVIKELMGFYGFNYLLLPKKADSIIGKVWKQIYYTIKLIRYCINENIELAIGTSVSIVFVSKLTKVKSIVFDDDDDEVQPLITRYVNPFVGTLLSPEALKGKRKRKDCIYYPGYHELAYLHPNRFTPDLKVLEEVGLEPNEIFFILRFNAFKAHHDIGAVGLSLEQKNQILELVQSHGKVFITTERDTEPEFRKYQLNVSPEKMHSLLAYASIFIGDSQTMTSEAAILGTPALRCNSFAGKISYLEEQEHKYNLTYAFLPEDFENLILKLQELLSMPNRKEIWQQRRRKMLGYNIDVTTFWTWLISSFPYSKEQIGDTVSFWYRFK